MKHTCGVGRRRDAGRTGACAPRRLPDGHAIFAGFCRKPIEESGIDPIDWRQFGELEYDEERYQTDSAYCCPPSNASGLSSRPCAKTGGAGVAIFVDNIGLLSFGQPSKRLRGRASLLLWLEVRHEHRHHPRCECINRHIHGDTHYEGYAEGVQAVDTARQTGWMAPVDSPIYGWDEIPPAWLPILQRRPD